MLEGPQVCLIIVNIIVLAILLVPVLDRGTSRGRPGPAVTDLGVAALLMFAFLTLEAWDIGVPAIRGVDPSGDPLKAHLIAQTAAAITLGAALGITWLRRTRFGHRHFVATGALAVLALLHGFAGVT